MSTAQMQPASDAVRVARGRDAYAWYVVAALLLVSVLGYLDRLVLGFLVEPIKAELHLTDTQVGLVSGLAFALLYVLMGAPIGWLLDRGHRVRVLAFFVAIWSACTVACGTATGFLSLFLARVGVGAGEAALNPAAVSLISDYFAPERVVRPLGVFMLGIYLGGGLAIILGGQLVAWVATLGTVTVPWLGELSGWRFVFVAVGLPGLLVAPLLVATVRDPRVAPSATARAARLADERPRHDWRAAAPLLTLLTGGFVAFGFGIYALLAWFPAMLGRTYGLSAAEIAWSYGPVYLVAGTAGALALGPITERLRRRGHADASLLVGVVAMACLAVAGAAGPLMPVPAACLGWIAVAIFCWPLVLGSSLALIAELIPAAFRGRATGAYMAALNVTGGALGPLLVGMLADGVYGPQRLDLALATVSAVFGPLAVLLLALGRRALRASAAAGHP